MWNWCLKELIVGCGLALLVGGGVWQHRKDSQPAAASVDLMSIPRELGDWSSTDFELPKSDVQAAEIATGYLARNYVHAESGEAITVLIVSGPGGPISVHPPEVCFAGQGYQKESVILPIKAPAMAEDREHQFSMAIFRAPESAGGARVQLFWSWSDTGIWQTPTNPRLAFARLPRLYKVYLSRTLRPDQGREDVKDCLAFMNLLLPEFEKLMSQPVDAPLKTEEPNASVDESKTTAIAFENRKLAVQSLLPVFAQSRNVRRNGSQFGRPWIALSPVKDGDFRS